MNSTMMLLLLVGGKGSASSGLIRAMIAEKKEKFKKWEAFILFLQTIVIQGFFWIRGIPQVQIQAIGQALQSGVQGTTLDAVMAQIQGGQQDLLVQWFVRDTVEKAVIMLLELIRPGGLEELVMGQVMEELGGGKDGCQGGEVHHHHYHEDEGPHPMPQGGAPQGGGFRVAGGPQGGPQGGWNRGRRPQQQRRGQHRFTAQGWGDYEN